jgi:hypothetical protein
LICRSTTADSAEFEKAAKEWADRARSLVGAAFGAGEAALFMDSAGYSFFHSTNRPNEHLRIFLNGRLRRLAELLQREKSLPLEEHFDPAAWQEA